jgi:hypothetical protein
VVTVNNELDEVFVFPDEDASIGSGVDLKEAVPAAYLPYLEEGKRRA